MITSIRSNSLSEFKGLFRSTSPIRIITSEVIKSDGEVVYGIPEMLDSPAYEEFSTFTPISIKSSTYVLVEQRTKTKLDEEIIFVLYN